MDIISTQTINTNAQPAPQPQNVVSATANETISTFSSSPIKSTAKDFFIYLAVYVLTLVSFFDVLSIIYRLVGHAFPEKAAASSYAYSMLSSVSSLGQGFPTWAVSSLMFALPALGVLGLIIMKSVNQEPERGHLFVRLLAQSATLYVLFFFILGTLSTFAYFFIENDITTAFIIKSTTSLALGLLVGGYYLYAIRHDYHILTKIPYVFFGVSSLVVISVIVMAFITFGRPVSSKKIAADAISSRNLQSISSAIESYSRKANTLPATLAVLTSDENSSYLYGVEKDFVSTVTYSVTKPLTQESSQLAGEYKLCYSFNAESTQTNSLDSYYGYSSSVGKNNTPNFYNHKKGQECYIVPVSIVSYNYGTVYNTSSASSTYVNPWFDRFVSTSTTAQ